jgi:hypothetical protein
VTNFSFYPLLGGWWIYATGMYKHIYIYIYIYTHTHTHTHTYLHAYVHTYVSTHVHMCVCTYVCVHACICVRKKWLFPQIKLIKDLHLTEHVQNITLFIFHFNSFNSQNTNSSTEYKLLHRILTPTAPTLLCTKAYKYLPDNVNYRQRQKLCKWWCKIFHN